jgi:hypothetical protein
VDDGAGGKTDTDTFGTDTQIRQPDSALSVGGTPPGGNYLPADIHHIQIFDRVLSSTEMDNIYNSGSQTVEDFYADPSASTGKSLLQYNEELAGYTSHRLNLGDIEDISGATTATDGQIIRKTNGVWTVVDDQPVAEITLTDTDAPDPPGAGSAHLFKLTGNRNLMYKPDAETDSVRVTNQSSLDNIGGVAQIVVSARPTGLYKFNETAFPTAVDTGTAVSGYDLDEKAGTVTSSEGYPNFGEPSSAALFDGVNGTYLRGSTTYPLNFAEDFSIVALVRSNNITKGGTILYLADDASNEVMHFYQTPTTGLLNALIWDEPTRAIQFAGSDAVESALSVDTWHYCFMTYDKSTGTLTSRLDDNAEKTGTYGGDRQVFQHSTAKLYIGGKTFDTTHAFPGEIEFVAIYDRLLTTTDMNNIYDSGNQEQEDLVLTSPNTLAANHALLYDTEAAAFVNQALTHSDISGNATATVSTTDATVTTIATVAITADTVNYIEATVIAKDANGDGAVYKLGAHVKDVAATTTLQNVTAIYTDEDVASMDATVTVSGNDALIRVTGDASIAADWSVEYRVETIA